MPLPDFFLTLVAAAPDASPAVTSSEWSTREIAITAAVMIGAHLFGVMVGLFVMSTLFHRSRRHAKKEAELIVQTARAEGEAKS